MAERDEHASREMVTQVREEVKQREKAIMQRLMAEERELWLDALYDKAKIYPDGVPATVAVMRRPRGMVYVFGVRPESRLSAEREKLLESWDEQ
jgi:hypothetical protein